MALQQWGPFPNDQQIIFDNGVFTSVPVPLTFTIKDIIGTPAAVGFSDFRLKSATGYPNFFKEWVDPASYTSNGYSGENYPGYISYSNGLTFDFSPVILGLSDVPNGNYSFVHYFQIEALNSSGIWILKESYTYTLDLEVRNNDLDGDVSFSPSSIVYDHKQNEPLPSKNITMRGLEWKIIGKPNFILSSEHSSVIITDHGSGTSAYQIADGDGGAIVKIQLSEFYNSEDPFNPSDLSGTFEILESGVHLSEIDWQVNVARLSDFITIPYSVNQKAFTLDAKFFQFFSSNAESYFQFDSEIKTFDFFTNTLNTNFISQKIVLFDGKQKINIGRLIHRLMRKFSEPNNNLFQYKEAVLKINCSERLLSDGTVIRSGVSKEIPFIAGLSRGISNIGFLDFNSESNRVTKNSFAYLNFILPLGNYELRTFKNGTLTGTPEAIPPSLGITICKKVYFNNFNQGDIVDFVIDEIGMNNNPAPKKRFQVFPEGNYSNHIVWENEFLLQSAIECTGTASIVPEGEFQSQTISEDLVEKLEHLSSSKNVKLNINTGWLMFSDIDTIESLMRSKRAWLIQGSNFISLRPISKKLPEKNLEEELIQFQLEFKINPKYDEETYTL